MKSIDIRDFDPRRIEPNIKEAVYLHITQTPAGLPVRQTALLVGGQHPGPLLLLLAGIHGDEYEGPLAIMRLFQELEPAALRGTLVAVTVSNVLAFETATRSTVVDGVNLNRAFPGDPRGSLTQQIAYWMGERLVQRADCCIDLHSGGRSDIPLLCAYKPGDGRVAASRQRVAEAFRAPVCLVIKEHIPTQVEAYAEAHEVPLIFTECPSLRGINRPAVAVYQRGVRNVLRVLNMLDGDLEGEPSAYRLYSLDDPASALNASVGGFFVADCQVLDKVQAGARLGATYDLAGNILEEFSAPHDGYVFMRCWEPTIHAGDASVFTLVSDERTW